MPINRLNLSALRAPGLTTTAPQVIPTPFGPGLGKLGVIRGPGAIGFTLNGSLRWLIDVRRFAGSPALTVQGGAKRVTGVELKGARFPGTELPADFVLKIQPTGTLGTPTSFKFTLGGFQGQVVLERWLAGQQALQSAVTLGQDVCPLGQNSKLSVNGSAEAWFLSTWQFQMFGTNLAQIRGLPDALDSDLFFLRLLFPTDPSISRQPKSKRTRLDLAAGSHPWNLTPEVTAIPIGDLIVADGLFDAIELEAGESATGTTAREMNATSSRTDGLVLNLAGDITNMAGQPASLALSRPSYAVAFDPTLDHSAGDDTFLTARFGFQTQWLALDGFGVAVSESPTGPAFEASTSNGEVTSFRCEPLLHAVSAPLAAHLGDQVATEPLPPAGQSFVPFVSAPGTQPGWGIVAGPAVVGKPRLSLPDFSVHLLRREDLLSLDFLLDNVALEGGAGTAPALVQKDTTQPARFVVRFNAPQNLGEQAIEEASDDGKGHTVPNDPLVTPVQVVAAGPSRLAFTFPAATTSIPYSLDSLLQWVSLDPSLVPVAVPDAAGPMQSVASAQPAALLPVPVPGPIPRFPQIREPLPTETAIEAPWQLFLSPLPGAAWKHSTAAVTLGNRTELWHTRLAVQTAEAGIDESLPRKIRAVWHTGYRAAGPLPGHNPVPFRMSLDPNDRDQIVRLSSTFNLFYRAPAIAVDKVFLSSLGAWLDVTGSFNPDAYRGGDLMLSLVEWRHKAAMARDNYVRVETEGYLLPFGHKAVLVKVTERKFDNNQDGHTAAFLRQRYFIVVKQPVVSYAGLPGNQLRGIPYRSVAITTLVTPDLQPPQLDGGFYSFFPQVTPGVNFPFHIVGRDAEQQYSQSSDFSAGLYFVERGGPYDKALGNYNGSPAGTLALAGQNVAFAPSGKSADTTLPTTSITVTASNTNHGVPFYPQMQSAQVSVPAIQQVTGRSGATAVKYFDKYVTDDLMNLGEVFLQTVSTVPVGFSGDQSGGVATPNLGVSGLSRKFGTVSGDPTNIAGGTLDPTTYFGDPGAQLFGVVALKDLIAGVFGDTTVPTLTTNRFADRIETDLAWAPHVKPFHNGPITLDFDDVTKSLTLNVQIVTPLAGGAPQASVDGALANFKLGLAQVVGIKFTSITFSKPAGKKLDVSADIAGDGLQFEGDLSFLNELRKYVPTNGFSDPPSVEVSTDGVTAGYTLAIPSIGVGVFSLENIGLSAALTLPFLPPNPLRFRFAFSEREHPFLITVSLLAGAGFFGIALGPDGVEMLEASLEVGANVSIDVVVASGNVHIMAGVYLKIDETNNDASQLTGYLRAGGSLDVLGLISASVEFYLGFTYYFGPPGKCKIAGEAIVTIEVHVLFFSASVSASLRREFTDPQISFADLIGPSDWDYYCDAFAA
jgi:hypothetical protein